MKHMAINRKCTEETDALALTGSDYLGGRQGRRFSLQPPASEHGSPTHKQIEHVREVLRGAFATPVSVHLEALTKLNILKIFCIRL